MQKIAIIGTAGRGDSGYYLDNTVYNKMLLNAFHTVEALLDADEDVTFVSGGAAWSDHLAIDLFLIYNKVSSCPPQIKESIDHNKRIAKLKLYLPAEFVIELSRYKENKFGKIANFYHENFAYKLNYTTLDDIALALQHENSSCEVGDGFYDRNKMIANDCDLILAYTFSNTDIPNTTGTLDTWNKAPIRTSKIHISIGNL